ncbi:MAG: glutathione S-transferase family protein [Hyphomicrobiales bacterium]|nr:glutathione S-transferase family protein [Hyphomicrobiales bacterium]
MMTLYGRANSSNVRKALWALDLMGFAYRHDADWGRGHRSLTEPEFQALSPFALIPVLRDGEAVIRESHAILRYLASKARREDLYPADLAVRAQVEEWMDWAGAELARASYVAVRKLILRIDLPGGDEAVGASVREWSAHMRIVDGALEKTAAYLAGADFTIADIPMGVAVNRWFMAPMDRPDFPALAAYYERLSLSDVYRRHVRNGLP